MSEVTPPFPVDAFVYAHSPVSRQRAVPPPYGDVFWWSSDSWRALNAVTGVRRSLVSSPYARGSAHSAGDARRSTFSVVGLLLARGKMFLQTFTAARLMRSVG